VHSKNLIHINTIVFPFKDAVERFQGQVCEWKDPDLKRPVDRRLMHFPLK
jgi:hypothetical protein